VEKKMVRASALVLAFCMLFDPRASWAEKTQKHMIVDLVKNTETTQKQMIVDWVKKKLLTKDQAIALNSSPFFRVSALATSSQGALQPLTLMQIAAW